MPERGTRKDDEEEKNADKPDLPPKGFAIAARSGFQLQSEDCGADARTVELVTNAPGLDTPDAVISAATAAGDLGKSLEARNKTPKFNASAIGGSPSVDLKPGINANGMLQATAGIPLASMPRFMKAVKSKGWGSNHEDKAVQHVVDQTPRLQHGLLKGDAPSNELQGFMSLIRQYLLEAEEQGTSDRGGSKRRSFPKGQFKIMARTTFTRMFALLPKSEREAIIGDMDEWIDLVCGDDLRGLEREGPVSKAIYNYDELWQTDGMSITTTREQWLRDMPEKDRLSMGGHDHTDLAYAKEDEQQNRHTKDPKNLDLVPVTEEEVNGLESRIEGLYEGIGAYGKRTDTVKYEGEDMNTDAVLVELRGLRELGPAMWASEIGDVFKVAEDAIAHPYGTGDGEKKSVENVQSEKQQELRKEGGVVESQIKVELLRHHLKSMTSTAATKKGRGQHTIGESGPTRTKPKVSRYARWKERRRLEKEKKKRDEGGNPMVGFGSDDPIGELREQK